MHMSEAKEDRPVRRGIHTKPQSKHIIQLQAKLEALNETESQKMAT
jgi:hypothetical protein